MKYLVPLDEREGNTLRGVGCSMMLLRSLGPRLPRTNVIPNYKNGGGILCFSRKMRKYLENNKSCLD